MTTAFLTRHINAGNLWSLPKFSAVPRSQGEIDYAAVRAAGFDGLQHYFPEPPALDAGLKMSGMARIIRREECLATARRHAEWGFVASTWHVGDGFETDAEMDALAGAVLDAAAATSLPISIETHRATMTQDMRRTIDLVDRFPELRFNADLSHWYTGLEMPYGDFDAKLDRIAPVLMRTRFMHGRIGHSCAMQLSLDEAREHICWTHFEALWAMCFEGFLQTASPGEHMIFAPELLPAAVAFQGETHRLNYAQLTAGEEVSDRWADAVALTEHADALFQRARRQAAS